jgi:hypothetical protein
MRLISAEKLISKNRSSSFYWFKFNYKGRSFSSPILNSPGSWIVSIWKIIKHLFHTIYCFIRKKHSYLLIMQKNQFRKCLYNFVIVVSFVITLSENNSKFMFTKESDLGGFTCPEQHAIYFKDKMSSSQCLATCADFKGCFSVFRHEESSRCIGCKDKYLTSDDAPVLLGTTFFRRRCNLLF